MKKSFYILFFLFASNIAVAEKFDTLSKRSGSIYFGDYEPVEPKLITEVPKHVRDLLIVHLTDRLGADFFNTSTFAGGQIIDKEKLLRIEPDSKDYEWEVPTYVLDFEFSLPEFGISSYIAQIELRADGSIIKEIDLPCFSCTPSKLQPFPLKDAFALVVKHGYSLEHLTAEVSYNIEKDSIVWVFSQQLSDDGLLISGKKLEIDAHTGEVIRDGPTEAMH